MDDVTCSGSESSLDHCPFSGWGINNCRHYQDAGVVCQGREVCTHDIHVCLYDACIITFYLKSKCTSVYIVV